MNGASLISTERARQMLAESYDPAHDDTHEHDELAVAAVQYALPLGRRLMQYEPGREADVPVDWPWQDDTWKPTPDDRVRELVKAGALIAAEIDRHLRMVPA